MRGRLYTEEQIKWIKEHRNDYPNPQDFVRDFNELFSESRSLESISNLCRKNKLVKSNFKKLSDTWHIGEVSVMNNGMRAKITGWRGYNDIDVEFENGSVKEHAQYAAYKKGTLTDKKSVSGEDFIKLHMHEKKMMNCGFECEIIAIRDSKDIDLKWCAFEDVYMYHKEYQLFKEGKIRLPAKYKWIHQKARMNCGMMAEITEYYSAYDIRVTFDDGLVVKSTTASWIHRTVDNPKISKKLIRKSRIGERRMMNSGLWLTIIDYKGTDDINVEYDDGVVRTGVTYTGFINGSIMHPSFTHGKYFTSRDFHGYILMGQIMRLEDDALYKVITPDGDKDIIKISEIINNLKAS